MLDQERKKEILKTRARELAKVSNDQKKDLALCEVVEFFLSEETYAIESKYIQEVFPIKAATPLPNTPPFVYGIINVRRKVTSVINLKIFFDLPQHKTSPENKAIILENEQMQFAILADEIIGIKQIPNSQIQHNLPTLTGIRQEFLKGITPERLVILDGEKLLQNQRIIVHMEE